MRKILVLIGLMLCSAFGTWAQVPVQLSPLAKQQFLSITGVPLAGGCLNTYITGTSTPLATYTDGTGSATNPNPIILDSGGFANIWLKNASYRFTLTSAGGVNCSTGSFQYTVDNISAYTVINQAQNIFLLGQTSDPAGSAGELIYRSDIPCFRGFTTLWDCFVTLTAAQTLTNKTLTAPAITSPTVTNGTFTTPTIGGTINQNGPATYATITNEGATGTTINRLTKLTGAPSTGIITTAADVAGGAVGICVAGCGTTSSATIQMSGTVLCTVDPAGTVAGDYIQISPSTTGTCHDAGATYPTSNQVIGRALTTTVAGNATIDLFSAEIRPTAAPITVVAVNTTGLAGNVASTPIVTPAVNGFYRASCYLVVTQAATVSSTLPNCQVTWNDADSNVAQTSNLTATVATNLLGTISIAGPGTPYFFAKSGVSISFQTQGFATAGATPMLYALHLRLEGPF